ncbi:MAG: phosphoglycerate kinase [Actinomycetota bacterium]|nr:phosphoglycerate kinase [Actinomycetota bacterium]
MYFSKKTIEDIDIKGKRVLVRVDFNVPLADGAVVDDSRIKAAMSTIEYLRQKQAKIILCSHLGRPKGKPEPAFSLKPVAVRLSELLGTDVRMMDETVGAEVQDAARWLKGGDIMLLENLRFNPGEAENDPVFAKKLADLAEVFVNDAFGVAHRRHASTVGVTEYLPAVAGLLLEKEVSVLKKLVESPKRPFMACLGGNKISDKIGVIKRFLDLVDGIVVGGGMCFTFLKAKGYNTGNSMVEENQVELAKHIIDQARDNEVALYLPIDIVAATEISPDANYRVVSAKSVPDGWLGLDIGPASIEIYGQALESAKTIFWNGPMGVFEIPQFSQGTKGIAQAITDATRHSSLSIVGGGDSLAALKMFDLEEQVSFASTGGGASLKILEGTPLPGVEALEDR